MDNLNNDIISVFVENMDLSKTDVNIVEIGQDISKKMNYNFVVIGVNLSDASIESFKNKDCKLINIKHSLLSTYNFKIYNKAISQAIKYIEPKYVLFTTTEVGKELSPNIASKFDTGMISDGIKYEITDENELLVDKPSFGDQTYAKIGFNYSYPRIISFRQNFNIEIDKNIGQCQYEEFIPDITIEDMGVIPVSTELLLETCKKTDRLQDAKTMIGVGLGIGSKENLEIVYKLASLIGAEVGVTKPLVDKGWADKNIQIGQTGRIINPDLYIAIGISGASQHIVGVIGAKKIIAINNNKDAHIFNIANVGFIGDCKHTLLEIIKHMDNEKASLN